MTLIICPECGHNKLSTFAEACPGCGASVTVILRMVKSGSPTSGVTGEPHRKNSTVDSREFDSLKSLIENCELLFYKPKVGWSAIYAERSITVFGYDQLEICAKAFPLAVESICFIPQRMPLDGSPFTPEYMKWSQIIPTFRQFTSLQEIRLNSVGFALSGPSHQLDAIDDEAMLLISKISSLKVINIGTLWGGKLTVPGLLKLRNLPELELVTLPAVLSQAREMGKHLDESNVKRSELKKGLPNCIVK